MQSQILTSSQVDNLNLPTASLSNFIFREKPARTPAMKLTVLAPWAIILGTTLTHALENATLATLASATTTGSVCLSYSNI